MGSDDVGKKVMGVAVLTTPVWEGARRWPNIPMAAAGLEPASPSDGLGEVPLLHAAVHTSRKGAADVRGPCEGLEGVLRLHRDGQRYVAAPRSSERSVRE